MASWLMHFRVADSLWKQGLRDLPPSLVTTFVAGNVAPDSGVPAPDGQGFIPDKNTSHFMRRFSGVPDGQNPERCDPAWLIDTHLTPAIEQGDTQAAAFFLGYLCHLVTDNAWVRDFIYPAKERFSHLRLEDGMETPEGVARFYAFVKKDWYDMDFLYLRHHPALPSYEFFLDAPPLENRYLPFFPEDAFETKRQEIREFYLRGTSTVTERELYISDTETEAFVEAVAQEVLTDHADVFHRIARLCQPLPV